ncbi:MAG: YqzL family protein [Bacillales bacterium]|nr:YqzL family protein [Bacillales bacterium]
MLDFTWKLFLKTGNIDTYLLYKELEKESQSARLEGEEELAEAEFPLS